MVAAEHLPGTPGHRLEEGELLRAQLDLGRPAPHPMGSEVEPEVTDREDLGTAHVASPRQGMQPGQQLVEGERLDQVVVRAGAEARDPVAYGAECGQHQDRRPVVDRPDPAAHLEPVDVGQHQVEDDHVVRPLGGEPDAVQPGGRHVRGHAFLAQPLLEETHELRLVLDQEDPHGDSLLPQMSAR